MSTPLSHAIVIKPYEWWNTAAITLWTIDAVMLRWFPLKKQFYKHKMIWLETIIPSVARLARPLTYGPKASELSTLYFNFTAASCSINGELGNCTYSGSQASTSIKLTESVEYALHHVELSLVHMQVLLPWLCLSLDLHIDGCSYKLITLNFSQNAAKTMQAWAVYTASNCIQSFHYSLNTYITSPSYNEILAAL